MLFPVKARRLISMKSTCPPAWLRVNHMPCRRLMSCISCSPLCRVAFPILWTRQRSWGNCWATSLERTRHSTPSSTALWKSGSRFLRSSRFNRPLWHTTSSPSWGSSCEKQRKTAFVWDPARLNALIWEVSTVHSPQHVCGVVEKVLVPQQLLFGARFHAYSSHPAV